VFTSGRVMMLCLHSLMHMPAKHATYADTHLRHTELPVIAAPVARHSCRDSSSTDTDRIETALGTGPVPCWTGGKSLHLPGVAAQEHREGRAVQLVAEVLNGQPPLRTGPRRRAPARHLRARSRVFKL